jgi:hypothetical protein
MWSPAKSDSVLPFERDVMTVHHSRYYQGDPVPPTDWDDPNPVAFVSTRGTYLVAVTGPKAWAEVGLRILLKGLASLGAGAKTTSGYGRMRVVKSSLPGTGPDIQNGNGGDPPRTGDPVGGEEEPQAPTPAVVYRVGEEVKVEVARLQGGRYTLIEERTGQQIEVLDKGFPWKVGTKVKLKVKKVTADGRITQVGP